MAKLKLYKGIGVVALAAAVWSLPAVVPITVVSYVHAEEESAGRKEKARRTPAMRNAVYEQLSAAQVAAEAENFAEAKRVLDQLMAEYSTSKKQMNSYELANAYNFYAFLYYSSENYPKAIEAYNKVLAQPDIPEAMEIGTRYSIAQLYFVVEDYAKAAEALSKWFAVAPNPAPDAYILLAQAYYQLKKYDQALVEVEKGMAEAKERGQEPKENWYLLTRVLYYEKNDIPKTTEILEILARKWPKKDYFLQLSGMYGELKKEDKQLAAMETVYRNGWMENERELVNMAYLYLGSDQPYKAARVLEKGIKGKSIEETAKHLELYGISLRQARENKLAVVQLEKAAKKANDGEMWSRLANIYMDLDRNAEAVDAARKSLKQGGGRRPDNTRVVLGMALYNLGKYTDAKKAFADAAKDKRSTKMAKQWIKFLDTEIERERQIAQDA